jgi:uncharacterized membrane protein YagU involved in acid resistance
MINVTKVKERWSMNQSLAVSLKAGILGGVIGGVIFGLFMGMMGKILMVARMVGSESLAVGWIIHMIISVIFGVGFGIIGVNAKRVIGLGTIYGVVLWIVGPLVVMPMMMGMGTNLGSAFTPDQLINLVTHVFFSLILSGVYKVVTNRSSSQSEKRNSA